MSATRDLSTDFSNMLQLTTICMTNLARSVNITLTICQVLLTNETFLAAYHQHVLFSRYRIFQFFLRGRITYIHCKSTRKPEAFQGKVNVARALQSTCVSAPRLCAPAAKYHFISFSTLSLSEHRRFRCIILLQCEKNNNR